MRNENIVCVTLPFIYLICVPFPIIEITETFNATLYFLHCSTETAWFGKFLYKVEAYISNSNNSINRTEIKIFLSYIIVVIIFMIIDIKCLLLFCIHIMAIVAYMEPSKMLK